MTVNKSFPKGVKFANAVFLGGALLCLIFFVYTLLKNGLQPYKFSLSSISGTVLCLTALRFRDDYKVNIVTGLISVFFIVYLMEILLFLWEPAPWEKHIARRTAAKKAGVPYDSRTKWQVFKDLRNEGIDAFPIVYPHYFLPDGLMSDKNPLLIMTGVSDATTILCNESGEYVIYESDEYGFNNPSGSWTAKQPDIMLLGDSFVHGGCVQQGDDMAGQLRKSGWNAINAGMGGNGPLFELATLKEYAEPMKPKVVLWVYYEDNDPVDFQKEIQSAFLMQYLLDNFSQDLMHRQTEVNQVLREYVEKKIKEYKPDNAFLNIIKLRHITFKSRLFQRIEKKSVSTPKPGPLLREVLKKARDRVSAWGGKLYFVYLPHWMRYNENLEHKHFHYREEVLSIVNDLDISVIDLHEEVFLKHPDPLSLIPFRLYGHYKTEAYRLFAEVFDRRLKSK